MCSNNTVFHGYGPYNRSYSPRTPSVQLAVGVLQDLLQYSSQLPELAREVGLNSILGILTSLLGLKSEVACECYGHLTCLGRVVEKGGGGHRAKGWTNQLHCLLASANGILVQLYQGSESEGTVQYEGPGVELLS
uniref:Uncharacterized protein n=1 Tax=Oncorhynchus tshawytscha TaxID=74940 RepID=A0AAZ3SMX1_ONCTS